MNSPSSPKDLAALSPGTRIFIDANIFIYHFTQTPLTAACTAFLQRVGAGDLHGVTSVVILAEVAHRLMILEAIRTQGLSSRTAVKKLKETPDLVRQLSHYKAATERIPSFNVTVAPVTLAPPTVNRSLRSIASSAEDSAPSEARNPISSVISFYRSPWLTMTVWS
jgi:predicted nucleic acid-binding protein